MTGTYFITSSTAIGQADPVNLAKVVTFTKQAGANYGGAGGNFQIQFERDENSVGPKTITWNYKSEEDRDNEYDKIRSTFGQDISTC